LLVLISIRKATHADDVALGLIDAVTWTAASSPAPAPDPGDPFFGPRVSPDDVLVAAAGVSLLGYAQLAQPMAIVSHAHVLSLAGLAVLPEHQGRGVGRQLVEAAVLEARARGSRRLTLRVLASNTLARRTYERCGFEIEGILRGEFFLQGQYVDDVLMAIDCAQRR
jgi:ribosomal protein S18 acetylase RimI-like enzyme